MDEIYDDLHETCSECGSHEVYTDVAYGFTKCEECGSMWFTEAQIGRELRGSISDGEVIKIKQFCIPDANLTNT